MKRRREGEEWYGKISYQDYEEEIKDPADVEKLIREGTLYTVLFNGKKMFKKKSNCEATYFSFRF